MTRAEGVVQGLCADCAPPGSLPRCTLCQFSPSYWRNRVTPPTVSMASGQECATVEHCGRASCMVCSVPYRFKGMQPREQDAARRLAAMQKQGAKQAAKKPSKRRR